MEVGKIYISGVIGEDVTLLDVIRQVKSQPKAKEFLVKIDSVGGIVNAGDDIYNYLVNLPQKVTTQAVKAYSIASKIFLAGSVRIVEESADRVIMAHLPWMEMRGTSNDFSNVANGLKRIEDDLLRFYSNALEIDENTLQTLLQKDMFLNAIEAIEMGFATQTVPALKAVAKYNNDETKDKNLMSKNETNFLQKVTALYKDFMGVRAELVLQDATGVELVFPDLNEGDAVEADAKVTVDGKELTGKHLMPDGSTIIAESGVVTEVKQPEKSTEETAEDEPVALDEDESRISDKDAVIAELEAKIAELEAKLADKDEVEAEAEDKMVAVMAKMIEKSDAIEAKYEALAKQIGSDFNPDNKKETKPNAQSKDVKSRAWQILNS